MPDKPIVERITINGVDISFADLLPPVDLAEEECFRISDLMDALEESEAAPFILSTSSSEA